MLAAIIIGLEACAFVGALVDIGHLRLVSGQQFTGARKIVAIQAFVVVAVVIFLQIVSTASGEQHDGSSKSIAGRLGSAIQSYSANNGGQVYGFSCSAGAYCGGIVDPDTFTAPLPGDGATASSGVVYTLGKDCKGTSSPTTYAIYYWQQRDNQSHCLDSNSS